MMRYGGDLGAAMANPEIRVAALKRIALFILACACAAIPIAAVIYGMKKLSWLDIAAVGVLLVAILLNLLERPSRILRELLEQPLPRAVVVVVWGSLAVLILYSLLHD